MESNKQRVVITGLGITCAIGNNKEEVLKSLYEGKTGVGKITLFEAEKLTSDMFGEVKADIPYRVRELDKPSRMEILTDRLIDQLLEDSGITAEEIDSLDERAIMSMATSVGSNTHLIEYTSDSAEGKYIPQRFADYPK